MSKAKPARAKAPKGTDGTPSRGGALTDEALEQVSGGIVDGSAFSNVDIEQVVTLVMTQTARDADADTKSLLTEVKAHNEQASSTRTAVNALKKPAGLK
jgi:hypothetical protein